MPVIGYADKLRARPGEKIRFMVSCDFSTYRADVVRMLHADGNKMGPGLKVEVIKTAIGGVHRGKKESYPQGSYVSVRDCPGLRVGRGFSMQAWIMPTRPTKGLQGIITRWGEKTGFGLFIDHSGRLSLGLKARGRTTWFSVRRTMLPSKWYFVACSVDLEDGRVSLVQEPVVEWPAEPPTRVSKTARDLPSVEGASGPLIIAACAGTGGDRGRVMGHFDGKIDRPRVFSSALSFEQLRSLRDGASPSAPEFELAGDWDFSQRVDTQVVVDRSTFQSHGIAINSPKRAVTGYNWTGREVDFKRAPQEYGAIHFHEDDLDDCRWEADFEFEVPKDFGSGIYAVRLRSHEYEDYVPFFVVPPRGSTGSEIAFLAPTLSYLAYGNDHFIGDPELQRTLQLPSGFKYPTTRIDRYLVKTNLLSLYDRHTDRSGVCYVSRLRPILTMRPDYLEAMQFGGKGAPHQFPADLWITDWMDAKGFGYDVITDEDLHEEGLGLIKPYRVIVTGTHPEYWTEQMLDALQRYLDEGGRVMYMGGNGFYWVTTINEGRPHIVEVRRWGGTQAWTSEPGEYYHSSTGELGGLWRNRGRAPQKMFGVGFTAQGHGPNRPYKRLPDSFDPRASFIFAGVGKDEVIGDFPCLDQGHGAAGYEFERLDGALGTPHHALLLASATGFSDEYQLAIEEVNTADSKQGGSVNPLVRADMVYFEYPNGGAVFSTGSVTWSGCLFYNGYENNVSKITENVLRKFSRP